MKVDDPCKLTDVGFERICGGLATPHIIGGSLTLLWVGSQPNSGKILGSVKPVRQDLDFLSRNHASSSSLDPNSVFPKVEKAKQKPLSER